MTEKKQKLVNAVKALALEKYERGGDVIVEAMTDEEIGEEIVGDLTRRRDVLKQARAAMKMNRIVEEIRNDRWEQMR